MSFTDLPFNSTALRWLYVDFNSYFASVEQQLNPALRGRPVAVVPVVTDSTCAIAASYEAKAYGIRTGTPVWEAKKMCPGLVCVLARHENYVEFHHRIREEIERHLPVSVVASIDEMACQLMDNENSPKRATEIALGIKEGLKEHIGEYVRCSIGVAPNRYLAKVATDVKKPDGLTLLSSSDLPAKLLPLSLRDLPGIGRNMETRIKRGGIHDMQSLWNLEPGEMRKLWGSVWGERMWYMLRGWEFEEEEHDRHTVGHSHVLAPELRGQEQARYVARRLTLKAASRLRRLGFYAGSLFLSVRIEQGGHWTEEAKCYRAQDNVSFVEMLESLWSRMSKETKCARIKKISISLNELLSAKAAEQPELFDVLPSVNLLRRKKAERLSFAMDKLNKRYGRDTVSLGIIPAQGRSFSGSKIAFTRIPDMQEFLE
jgi:DNA polymerase-4